MCSLEIRFHNLRNWLHNLYRATKMGCNKEKGRSGVRKSEKYGFT